MIEHPDKETTYAYNGLPSSHIIGETKLVVEGMETFLHEIDDQNFETTWKKVNQNEKINAAEAVIEYMARFTDIEEWVEDTQPNSEYIKRLIQKEDESCNSPFDHSTVTVLFNNVSMMLVKSVLEYRLNHLIISESARPVLNMGFWLPPAMESNENYKEVFSQIFANLNDIKTKFFESMDLANLTNEEIHKKVADVSRIYPWGTQIICSMTAGLGIWRNLFKLAGSFNADPELRFIFLHLAYKFKNRYTHVFQDMVVMNAEGETFGFDTVISSLDAWKYLKIHFKQL